jgi:hypothetical protein
MDPTNKISDPKNFFGSENFSDPKKPRIQQFPIPVLNYVPWTTFWPMLIRNTKIRHQRNFTKFFEIFRIQKILGPKNKNILAPVPVPNYVPWKIFDQCWPWILKYGTSEIFRNFSKFIGSKILAPKILTYWYQYRYQVMLPWKTFQKSCP